MGNLKSKLFICSGLVAYLLFGQGCSDDKESDMPITIPSTEDTQKMVRDRFQKKAAPKTEAAPLFLSTLLRHGACPLRKRQQPVPPHG
jgi:hypothetical protein